MAEPAFVQTAAYAKRLLFENDHRPNRQTVACVRNARQALRELEEQELP